MKRMVACDLLWLAAASCLLTLVSPSTTHQGECLLTRDPIKVSVCSPGIPEAPGDLGKEQRKGGEKAAWLVPKPGNWKQRLEKSKGGRTLSEPEREGEPGTLACAVPPGGD